MKLKLLFLCVAFCGFAKAQTSTNLTVTPNPMYEEAVITFTASTGDTINISVANAAGNIILTTRTNAILPAGVYNDSINLINYPSGIYFVLATFGHNAHSTAKIVKQGSAVGIPVNTWSSSLNVFPNPFKDLLHVETNEPDADVAIMNALGQVVYKNNYQPQNALDLRYLPSGIYFLKFSANGGSRTIKTIKE